jgi:hypothetical protein
MTIGLTIGMLTLKIKIYGMVGRGCVYEDARPSDDYLSRS